MILAVGRKERAIDKKEFEGLCEKAISKCQLEGKRILAIIPDSTRTVPMPVLFKALCNSLSQEAKKLDFLIALGTHSPMNDQEIDRHLGINKEERKGPKNVEIFNHRWNSQKELRKIGLIPREEMRKLSGSLIDKDVPVLINKRIFDYDQLLLIGPVFPHEVVGFSGGYKYFFPGISGPEMVNLSHWLGALLTNPKINGIEHNPVRELINRAASFVTIPSISFCLVMRKNRVQGLYVGNPIEAQEKAAGLSKELNIVHKKRQFHTVLSTAPQIYKELWTGGKCMYKLEPVVEDGGRLIIYAPHIKEISSTHGKLIEEVGYHLRDYFLRQWDRFKNYPGAVLAHSTHVKGIGTYKEGVEKPRIEVVLATGIPKKVCKHINLGYMNPKEIDPEEYAEREEEGILLVRGAGETLYRLADGSLPDIDRLYEIEGKGTEGQDTQ